MMSYMYFLEHVRAINIIFVNNQPSTLSSLAANCVYYFSKQTGWLSRKKQDMAWWKEKLCLVLSVFCFKGMESNPI